MSQFDEIQTAVFSTVESVFGDIAVWKSSKNELKTEKVLYNCPNNPLQVGGTDKYEYRPYDYYFEYHAGQFEKLKLLVDAGSEEEVVINGKSLLVREVRAKFDGKTLTAFCELK